MNVHVRTSTESGWHHQAPFAYAASDSLAERSKAPDSSSGGEIRVGSNPTAVIIFTCEGHSRQKTPPTGLEPAIFGLEVQRVIHYATGAYRYQTSCALKSSTGFHTLKNGVHALCVSAWPV